VARLPRSLKTAARWMPTSIEKLYLPPYSPNLNPIEQVFRHAQGPAANRGGPSVETLRRTIGRLLDGCDPDDGHRHPLEVGNGDAGGRDRATTRANLWPAGRPASSAASQA
jgi:hypothetical protein